jgi:hypothetical protein
LLLLMAVLVLLAHGLSDPRGVERLAEAREQTYGAVDVGDDRQHRLKGWTLGAGVNRTASPRYAVE